MDYKHVIWDWNGTLLNDRWLCLESINTLLGQRGKNPLSEKEYLAHFDFPVRDYYERAGFDFSKEDFKIPALQFIDLYEKKRKVCKLQTGALDVLQYFMKTGVSQSLLSASEEGVLKEMLNNFCLGMYFQIVTGLNNHYAASKLELGRKLLEKIGLPPQQVLMVGDTCHDQEVAQALGIDIILYNKGHFPAYRLEKCGCKIISDLGELID